MDMSVFIKPKSQNPSENTGGDAEQATGESLTSEFHIPTIPTLKLKALFKDIETELKHREVTDKKQALERMRDIAAEYGLTLSEVMNKDGNYSATTCRIDLVNYPQHIVSGTESIVSL